MSDYDFIRSSLLARIPSAYNNMMMTDTFLNRRLATIQKYRNLYETTRDVSALLNCVRIIDATIRNIQDNRESVTDSDIIVADLKNTCVNLVMM